MYGWRVVLKKQYVQDVCVCVLKVCGHPIPGLSKKEDNEEEGEEEGKDLESSFKGGN